jgi:hypothetical protein
LLAITVLVAPGIYVKVGPPFGTVVVWRFPLLLAVVGKATLDPTMEANFSGGNACVYPRLANQDSHRIVI